MGTIEFNLYNTKRVIFSNCCTASTGLDSYHSSLVYVTLELHDLLRVGLLQLLHVVNEVGLVFAVQLLEVLEQGAEVLHRQIIKVLPSTSSSAAAGGGGASLFGLSSAGAGLGYLCGIIFFLHLDCRGYGNGSGVPGVLLDRRCCVPLLLPPLALVS